MKLNNKVKIIFWGTPEFALPSLGALIKNNYDVVAVITNPDEPRGREQILTPPPVKVLAQKFNIPILQPVNLKIENCPSTPLGAMSLSNGKLKIPHADLHVVAAYGKIIPKEILDVPKYGALNIHPSLLPSHRGPSPIQYTILNGDTETGVTIILMDEKMDHGPIVAMRQLANYKSQITSYKMLHDQLAGLGAELLIETLPKWLAGEIKPIPQDESKATYCKILKKEDGRIDWVKPAQDIERQIRAFQEWPKSYTFWQKGKNRLRLEIEEAGVVDEKDPTGMPGLVWQKEPGSLLVETGKGSLRITKIKLEGKKTLQAREFLNGYKDILGSTLS